MQFLCVKKVNSTIPKIRNIHPYKQDIVSKIFRRLDKTNLDKVIIFGSSITNKCNQYSDLDIAIKPVLNETFSSYNRNVIMDETHGNCDLINLNELIPSANKTFYDNIMKGVVIYDKESEDLA